MAQPSSPLPVRASTSHSVLACLLIFSLASGCAALIYEVVWFQLLQLVIGLTNVSLGLLLVVYMGGMCLGSILLASVVSPSRHPLRVYAMLELCIGVIGVAVLFIVPGTAQLYSARAPAGLAGFLSRGLLAALCLLPPTICMGATLPAVSRWMQAAAMAPAALGAFYAANIAGAVLGCLVAGFYLLPAHNMATATYAAASINFAVALSAWRLASLVTRKHVHAPVVPPHSPPTQAGATTQAPSPNFALWTIYLTAALSGLTALGAEVIWTRLLSLLLGGTVYTFSIILAVFLGGLGIGSALGAAIARTAPQARLALGLCQLFLVLGITWTAWIIASSLPYWPINPALSRSPWFNFQLDLARCLWAMLPPTILWGASFPLALASLPAAHDSGRPVGRLYAANTLGAIIGALTFSLVVIPSWGTHLSHQLLLLLAAVAALVSLAPLVREPFFQPATRRGIAFAAFLSLPAAAWLALAVPAVPWGVIAYGRFMATYADRLAPGIRAEKDVPAGNVRPDIYATYVGEGLNGSVAVTKWTTGARNFHSAGKVQASSEPSDMRLQRMLGHLSGLAHQKPESVLVVACGAGVTAGTFVLYPSVRRIVICDIEPLVPKIVAPMFEKENHAVLKDPRTQVVFDDGRHFIRTSKEQFDIITSDPIDPWVKGSAALNTIEYYQMCRAHLNPGGVMTLWIPFYESNTETAKSAIATFFTVFPNGILFSNDNEEGGYDAILFGQAGPTEIDVDEWQARLGQPDHARIQQSLRDVGFAAAVSLLATYAASATDLLEWARGAQMNTDQNLRLQYLAGKSFNSFVGSEILSGITRYRKFPENIFVGSGPRRQMLKARFKGASPLAADASVTPGSGESLSNPP